MKLVRSYIPLFDLSFKLLNILNHFLPILLDLNDFLQFFVVVHEGHNVLLEVLSDLHYSAEIYSHEFCETFWLVDSCLQKDEE